MEGDIHESVLGVKYINCMSVLTYKKAIPEWVNSWNLRDYSRRMVCLRSVLSTRVSNFLKPQKLEVFLLTFNK